MSDTESIADAFFGLPDSWVHTAPDEVTHLHDMGSGVPVTFIHGSGAGVSAAANWWLNLPSISSAFRTIAFDLLGFGQTVPAPRSTYGIDAWMDHTIRLLDALEIEKTWLVGNSLGGWIALQFALDHPERLHGVISMGTGGAPRTKTLVRHGAPNLSAEGIRTVLEGFVTDGSLVSEELVNARLHAAQAPGAEERFRQVIAAREHDRVHHALDFERLRGVDMPVLLLHGREDTVIPATHSWNLVQAIPHADLHLFSQCGHWSQVERAEEFNAVIMQYLYLHTPKTV